MRILPGVIAMATIVVASNILVQFLILDGLLTWGAFTYPLAFLVTDIMNRVYGAKSARTVVLSGLVVGIICSLIGANRDPSRWERPDDFDLSRSAAGHLGFGLGPHFCVGHATARLEAEMAEAASVVSRTPLAMNPKLVMALA